MSPHQERLLNKFCIGDLVRESKPLSNKSVNDNPILMVRGVESTFPGLGNTINLGEITQDIFISVITPNGKIDEYFDFELEVISKSDYWLDPVIIERK
tara:strand:+ start:4020 stop:4313 length:294 start_codon:yes stop_codon:yes gene_type:complete